jgi:hypothetical protein
MTAGSIPPRGLRRPGRIGPWRLLDIVHATMPWRGGLFGGGAAVLPEFGPPDSTISQPDPEELPGSNIGHGEQQQAIMRERARRFIRVRR